MNDPLDPAAKAEAVRAREEEARRKARKNTIVFGMTMFGIVFALLSFKYVTGSDPSLRTDSLAAQREAVPAQTAEPEEQWQGDDDEGDEGDDGWEQPQQQSPDQSQGQTTSPPTTGAS